MSDSKKVATDFGINAKVERTKDQSELAQRANLYLRQIGEDIVPVKGLLYKGSAAIHIYQSEILGQVFFVSQTATLQDCPEVTASKAFDALRSDMQASYGRRRQTKRSGF